MICFRFFSDVVAAYKGLLKEKEALESSLVALSSPKTEPSIGDGNNSTKGMASTSSAVNNEASGPEIGDEAASGEMQMQIATVMQSLATLSAEKSKMEASFQADKVNKQFILN